MTPDSKSPHKMRDELLKKIQAGRVAMRPRAYFILSSIVLLVLAVLALAVSVLLVSYVSFMLRATGHEFLLGFGLRGIEMLAMLFPWPLLALDILLLVAFEAVLRRFRFGYRSPALYLLCVIVVIAIVAGGLLDRGTNVNDDLLRGADRGELGPVGALYEHVRDPLSPQQGVFRGIVVATSTNRITLHHDDFDNDHDDGTVTVVPPPGFDMPAVHIGDRLYVAGTVEEDGVMHAYGIQAFSE